jgi:hypothetical protein
MERLRSREKSFSGLVSESSSFCPLNLRKAPAFALSPSEKLQLLPLEPSSGQTASSSFRLILLNGAESMTNVLGLFLPESVFGNACGVISNPFQKARNENDVQVGRYLFRVSDHATS